MAIRRTRHAVYEANYHLVWTPKYRKWILRGDLREYVCQLFHRIAEQYDYELEKLTIAEDHVHMLVSFPPRDSIAKVVARFKSISASLPARYFANSLR
jgi:putative transposase